jgi:histidinol phosphatase-like PHP family hydrolase
MPTDTLYKVDLHVHAAERSGCATDYEEAQIRAAIAAGLHGMAFTDHHAMPTSARLDELNRKYHPFHIYAGIEITANQEDWLVLGLRDPELTRAAGWTYSELVAYVRARGGFIVLAHPYRYADHVRVEMTDNTPDAIEYRSNNTPVMREGDIRSLAAQLGAAPLCNSDAHSSKLLGCYFNLLSELPQDDSALVEALHRLKS